MKAKQRKLIPAISMLLVAAVTLTTASYAWFTMSREVSAEGIKLTAVAPTNLLIASGAVSSADATAQWDGTNHGKFSSTTDVKLQSGKTGAEGVNAGRLIPSSSIDGATFYYPDVTDDAGKPKSGVSKFTAVDAKKDTLTDKQDGYYVDIPLWLKNEGEKEVEVVLKTNGTQGDSTNVTKIETTSTEENLKDLYKAVRFAVLDESGKKDADSTKYMYRDKSYSYLPAGTTGSANITGPVEAADKWEDTKDPSELFATDTNTDNLVAKVAAGATKKITVRVWLEGQDASCLTKNSAGKIAITLAFADSSYVTVPTV